MGLFYMVQTQANTTYGGEVSSLHIHFFNSLSKVQTWFRSHCQIFSKTLTFIFESFILHFFFFWPILKSLRNVGFTIGCPIWISLPIWMSHVMCCMPISFMSHGHFGMALAWCHMGLCRYEIKSRRLLVNLCLSRIQRSRGLTSLITLQNHKIEFVLLNWLWKVLSRTSTPAQIPTQVVGSGLKEFYMDSLHLGGNIGISIKWYLRLILGSQFGSKRWRIAKAG